MTDSGEDGAVRREVELPGVPFDGTLAEALGITITDEMQEQYHTLLARIEQMERTPWPHELWVLAGRPRNPADVATRWVYLQLCVAVGHVTLNNGGTG